MHTYPNRSQTRIKNNGGLGLVGFFFMRQSFCVIPTLIGVFVTTLKINVFAVISKLGFLFYLNK